MASIVNIKQGSVIPHVWDPAQGTVIRQSLLPRNQLWRAAAGGTPAHHDPHSTVHHTVPSEPLILIMKLWIPSALLLIDLSKAACSSSWIYSGILSPMTGANLFF